MMVNIFQFCDKTVVENEIEISKCEVILKSSMNTQSLMKLKKL